MKHIPSYPKVLILGSNYTENAFVGDVIIQEKVDGSQFGFGVNEDGQLIARSKGKALELDAPEKLFGKGVEYLKSICKIVESFPSNTFFYAEYLASPKHNVLKYDRVPKNNIVLFDGTIGGVWATRSMLEEIALKLDVDIIPELYKGSVETKRIDLGMGGYKSSSIDFLKRIIETTPSFLGNELIEGTVIKNYSQLIMVGGQIYPLFTKYVREAFKERHDVEWKVKSPKGALDEFIDGFRSNARWQKALIHLREKGLLENHPRDIAKLIKTVQDDIEEEEGEYIKNFLYNKFLGNIKRKSISGLPEWYKEKLLENIK